MLLSTPFEGFTLAYWRTGVGPPVVLLHGWPGDHTDFNQVASLLGPDVDVLTPDLRGFGMSDKRDADAEQFYSGTAQARAVAALLDELGLHDVVVAGYDVGSFVAQTLALRRPDLVKALVISPPIPGAGTRVLELAAMREFWYTNFHQLDLVRDIIDGHAEAVRAYLQHFWSHWSGPDYRVDEARIEHLVNVYAPEGAFVAAARWYRTSSNPVSAYATETIPEPEDRLAAPTTILWQTCDPIFPDAWSDRIDDFFADAILLKLPGVGHFTPLEAPALFADAVGHRLAT